MSRDSDRPSVEGTREDEGQPRATGDSNARGGEAGGGEAAGGEAAGGEAAGGEAGSGKLLTDFGPLVVFAITYKLEGIYWATGALMITAPLALAYGYAQKKRLEPVPLVTAVIVLVFGGLTIALGDPRFIYVKPTLVSGLAGVTLVVGALAKKSLMKPLFGTALELSELGWRALSMRFGLFMMGVAATNELVWRTFTPARETVWIYFKLFGIPGLTALFFVTQLGFLKRHAPTTSEAQ